MKTTSQCYLIALSGTGSIAKANKQEQANGQHKQNLINGRPERIFITLLVTPN